MFRLLNAKSFLSLNPLIVSEIYFYRNKQILNKFSIRSVLNNCNHKRNNWSQSQQNRTQNPNLTPNETFDSFEERPQFPGSRSEWTQELKFIEPNSYEGIPVYRIVDTNGNTIESDLQEVNPKFDKEFLIKLYRGMVRLNQMDTILYNAQRQGRISFYITSHGEEATHFGPAAALDDSDLVFGQYREPGVLIWRGFKTEQFLDQCFGNRNDLGKGRQMPIHYGSKQLNFVTIKSTLTSQMVHSVGAAYALKLQANGRIALCYFGDGAASEGDAHAALNFAATLDTPVIFFCRNNGFAISTPTHEQYRGDGIAARGPALGIPTIRIDGNDVLAAFCATSEARKICIEESRPVLIEAMTYRVGHHSTSDDSSAYRSVDEVKYWQQRDHPILRLRRLLNNRNWFNETQESDYKEEVRKEIMSAIVRSEKVLKPSIKHLFTDVYEELPEHLNEQYNDLLEHLSNYGDYYPKNLEPVDPKH